ncbi:MAG: hypothetical protein AB7R55_06925 [Gemmatimonadales bacterium]
MLVLGAVLMATLITADDPVAKVTVDEGKRLVVVTAGPFHVPSMPPGMNHEDMEMMNDHNTPLVRFEWPIQGFLRGFKVEIEDAEGKALDRRMIHHLIGVNFARRQLLYSAVERLFGIGQETDDVSAPRTIGVPMTPGDKLGMYMAWQNETGKDLDGVVIRVVFEYSPPNLNPRPLAALPIYMDVNLTVGGSNSYDVPPGKSEKAYEFTMPIGGRLLGFGGHLHDFGSSVRLEEVVSGKVVATVTAARDGSGKVSKVSRSLPGVGGDGIKLEKGKRYRVVGVYDNPTSETVARGAMAHISGLFAPDDYSAWPKLDLSDETLQDDLASLNEMGRSGGGHSHH